MDQPHSSQTLHYGSVSETLSGVQSGAIGASAIPGSSFPTVDLTGDPSDGPSGVCSQPSCYELVIHIIYICDTPFM